MNTCHSQSKHTLYRHCILWSVQAYRFDLLRWGRNRDSSTAHTPIWWPLHFICCITAKLYVLTPVGIVYTAVTLHVHTPPGTLKITVTLHVHSPAGTLYITATLHVHSPGGTMYISALVYVHSPTGSMFHFANTVTPQITIVSTTYYNRLGNLAIMQLSGTIWYFKWKYKVHIAVVLEVKIWYEGSWTWWSR